MSGKVRRYVLMNGVLGAVCLALAVILYLQVVADIPRPATDLSQPSLSTAEAGDAAGAPPRFRDGSDEAGASFDAIAERPLFAPTRRPPDSAEAPETPPQATPPPAFVLRGVVHSGRVRRALLETDEGTPLLRLREGETLDGWEVVTILPRKLVMRQGEQSLEVLLTPPQPAAR